MPHGQFVTGWFTPFEGFPPVDPGYGKPEGPPHIGGGPITPPALPGYFPPPGHISPPIYLPPGGIVSPPIWIPDPPPNIGGQPPVPGQPLPVPPLPPVGIYPPLPPESGISGKVAILVWVVGVGYRWAVVETKPVPEPKK